LLPVVRCGPAAHNDTRVDNLYLDAKDTPLGPRSNPTSYLLLPVEAASIVVGMFRRIRRTLANWRINEDRGPDGIGLAVLTVWSTSIATRLTRLANALPDLFSMN